MPVELESAIKTPAAESASAPPPPMQVIQMIFSRHISAGISVIARLGVADHLGSEPVPVEQIAREVEAHAPSLYRVMRLLASAGVFNEHPGKRFSQNALSETLRTDAPVSTRNMAIMSGDEWAVRGMGNLTHCVQTGEDGIADIFGKNVFKYFNDHPDQARTFHGAMTDFSKFAGDEICNAYDFSGIRKLADVGGGHGLLLASILKRNTQLRGIVYDLPEVVSGAVGQPHAREYADRLEFQSGSFLEDVPLGCDAFIIKNIIHDWSDEICIKILKNMKERLPENGRVLVCELVVRSERKKSLQLYSQRPGSVWRESPAHKARCAFSKPGRCKRSGP